MKKLVVAAMAAAAASTPAVARDNSAYVGLEGGVILADDMDFDASGVEASVDDAFSIDFKPGFDLDLILGYDFGMIRAEGELAYKWVGVDEIDGIFTEGTSIDGDGHVGVTSLMGNVLLDFGDDDSTSFYVGGGAGWARVKPAGVGVDDITFNDKDSGLAWQLIAGVRYAITPHIDIGAKYRYFRTRDLDFSDDIDDFPFDSFDGDGFRSHSLLFSFIYNFAPPPPPPPPPPLPLPPPPPPPPPPATQTCPDGSVILATDPCPVPPPPPPPPPPAPERGRTLKELLEA